MTPEEIKAFVQATLAEVLPTAIESSLTPMIATLSSNVQGYVTEAIAGAIQPETAPPETTEADPVAQRLKQVEEKLAAAEKAVQEKDAAALKSDFHTELSTAIDGFGTKHKAQVSALLSDLYQGATKDKTQGWLTKDGTKLTEAVTSFFGTDFGKHLLPSDAQPGTGTAQPEARRSDKSTISATEALNQAF